ncbi:hypothetical protein F5Y13DRAFT_200638 [Hypoxylon sp. FL1857]|nr:hypothetical protein F5Y13DRAFT_200638 [Hypoxylon sp. FL1857]
MEHDISFFKCETDQRYKYARRALVLDRVIEGHWFISQSPLLQLPTDMLTDIVDLLADDKPALASLALVNKTCRQLARSSQFAEVVFDYSPRAYHLLFRLTTEANSRTRSQQQPPTIGACIRKFTVKGSPERPGVFENFNYTGQSQSSSMWSINQNLKFLPALLHESVLPHALPNLQFAVWSSTECLDEKFLGFMTRSATKLRVWKSAKAGVDVSALLQEELSVPGTISSRFYDRLFRACAPTLESLNWHDIHGKHGPSVSYDNDIISFPKLRFLSIDVIKIPPHIFSSFLRAPLRHLSLPRLLESDVMGEALANCNLIQSLETLVIWSMRSSKKNAAHIASFIERHEHIEKLYVQEFDWIHGESARIVPYIIPVLSEGNFKNLKSLSLGFGLGGVEEENMREELVSIPGRSLRVVGGLTSLEQLHLSAGEYYGWRHQWLIDHDKLRVALRHLKRLRKLAFSRDTYEDDGTSSTQGYYLSRICSVNVRLEAMSRPDLEDNLEDLAWLGIQEDNTAANHHKRKELWERAHRNRMLIHAENYAAVLPALEWMYLGQRAISIQSDPNDPGRRMALPLTNSREQFSEYLYDMFAMGGGRQGI